MSDRDRARFVQVGGPGAPIPFDWAETQRLLQVLSTGAKHASSPAIVCTRNIPLDLTSPPPAKARRPSYVAPTAIAALVALGVVAAQAPFVQSRLTRSLQPPSASEPARAGMALAVADVDPPAAFERARPEPRQAARFGEAAPAVRQDQPAMESGPARTAPQLSSGRDRPLLLASDRPVQLAQAELTREPMATLAAERLETPPAEVASADAPAAPVLVVSPQASDQLLGGPSGRPLGGLSDIRSGNPLRMVSAITAAGR